MKREKGELEKEKKAQSQSHIPTPHSTPHIHVFLSLSLPLPPKPAHRPTIPFMLMHRRGSSWREKGKIAQETTCSSRKEGTEGKPGRIDDDDDNINQSRKEGVATR